MTHGRDNPRLHKTITRETLQRDRDRRAKQRAAAADKYDRAADVLERDVINHYEAVTLLREEAARWRR